MSDQERKYWLDDRRNVNKIIYGLGAVWAVLLAADLFPYKHHLHFGFERSIGFYVMYGFFSSVGLVLAAKVLRKVVMRDKDHYA